MFLKLASSYRIEQEKDTMGVIHAYKKCTLQIQLYFTPMVSAIPFFRHMCEASVLLQLW
jgi:hypothetical protein